MRRLVCPKCQNTVAVGPGEEPVCDRCGFGRPAQGGAGPDAAAPAATRARAGSPPPRTSGARRTAIIVAAAVLVLAGAAVAAFFLLGDDAQGGLDQAEAEARAEAALAALADGLAGNGGLHLVEGTMQIEDNGTSGGGFGGSFEVDMEYGADGARRMRVAFGGVGIEVYCTDDGITTVFQQQAVLERPPKGGCDNAFQDAPLDEDEVPGLGDPNDAELVSAEAMDDGTVRAVYRLGNDTITLDIDDAGRATRLVFEGDDADGSFDLTYGTPRSLKPPEAQARDPLDIEINESASAEGHRIGFGAATADAPVSDFEAHVLMDGEVVATFPLAQGSGSDGGHGFTFEDDDGLLNEGDELVVTGELDDAEVAVHDLWADRAIGETALAPALAWPIIVGLLACIAWRRRTGAP